VGLPEAREAPLVMRPGAAAPGDLRYRLLGASRFAPGPR
jgi:hypothetical protein